MRPRIPVVADDGEVDAVLVLVVLFPALHLAASSSSQSPPPPPPPPPHTRRTSAIAGHTPRPNPSQNGPQRRRAGAQQRDVALEHRHDEEGEGVGHAAGCRDGGAAVVASSGGGGSGGVQAELQPGEAGGYDEDAEAEDGGEGGLLAAGDGEAGDGRGDHEDEPGVGGGVEAGGGDEERGEGDAFGGGGGRGRR